jgi:hypothetical protein
LAASYVVWADGNVLVQSGTASGQLLASGGVASVDVISVNSNGNAANGLEGIGEDYNTDGHVDAHVLTIANDAITGVAIAANALNGKGDWNTTTPPTASQNADAVWDEARSGHTTNGTYGAVSEWAGANSLTASDVWTYATRTLTAYNWGGAGAYAITVNVKEGVTNMSGASVSFTQGSDVYTATTNASGNASFSLDNGSYTLAIVKSGYSFTPESVTVSALATLNKTITATSLPPAADPARKTIQITTKDGNGATQTAKSFYWRLTSPPTDDGFAYDYSTHTATTNGSGVFTDEWLIGGKYEYWRDDNKKVRRNVTIAADTDELPEV